MFCRHCGKEIEDDSRFCVWCGKPVSGEAGGAETAPGAQASTVPETASYAGSPAASGVNPVQTPGNKKPPTALIAVPMIALLVIIAIVAVVMTQPGGNASQSAASSKPAAEASQSADAQSAASSSDSASAASSSAASSASSEQSASSESAAASKAEASSDAAKAASEQAEASDEAANQDDAEAEAREAAEADGMQVFSGTIFIEDAETRMQEVGAPYAIDTRYGNHVYAFMVLDGSATVTAKNNDGATNDEEPYRTHDGVRSILLGGDYQDYSEIAEWEPYEGQSIVIGATPDEMAFFSDSTGALFDVSADAHLVFAVNEGEAAVSSSDADGVSSESATATSGDYILPDSASRVYSRSELEKLDNHTLFLARNEIYARHGRKFKSVELQQYFGSKSWYKPTINPDDFDEDSLNDAETENANAMLDIEQGRGSRYA